MIGVGFSTAPGLGDWLIRRGTGCPASHCWLYVHDGAAPATVIEAALSGVVEWGFQGFTAPNGHRRIVGVYQPDWDLRPAVLWARGQIGCRYSVDQDVLDGLSMLAPRPARSFLEGLGLLFGGGHSYNCSWLVCRALQQAGLPAVSHIQAQLATPANLLDVLKEFPRMTIPGI